MGRTSGFHARDDVPRAHWDGTESMLKYSLSLLHLPTLISQTTIVSEKYIVLPFFPYKSMRGQIWPCRKIVQGQLRVIIWTISSTQCCIPTFNVIGLSDPERMIFYHIWAWRPYWSCYMDHFNNISFPYPMEAPHENWLQSAQWFPEEKKMFENVDIHTYIHTYIQTDRQHTYTPTDDRG